VVFYVALGDFLKRLKTAEVRQIPPESIKWGEFADFWQPGWQPALSLQRL
jgi:hypothetical protein